MAAGVARGRLSRRAHGRGDLHAEGRVRTARPFPPGARGARSRGADGACGRPRRGGVARLAGALSNLERFFAGTIHSFCARLLRERPVESGVSPGFTELDEVQDLELRQRAWRDFITSARAGRRSRRCWRCSTPTSSRRISTTRSPMVCENDDVEFPPGDGGVPGPDAGVRRRSRRSGRRCSSTCRRRSTPTRTCKMQQAARDFERPAARVAEAAATPAVVAALLGHVGSRVEDHPEVVGRHVGREEAAPRADRGAARGLSRRRGRRRTWRSGASTSTACPSAAHPRARRRAADERRRLNALNYGDLLNLTARVLRENVDVRRALQQQVPLPARGRVPGHRPGAGRDRASGWRRIGDGVRPASDAPAAGLARPCRCARARSSSSATRSSRSTASAAPTSTSTTSSATRFSEPAVGSVLPLTLNFRSAPQLCAVGERGLRHAASRRSRPRMRRGSRRSTRTRQDRGRPGGHADARRPDRVHAFGHAQRLHEGRHPGAAPEGVPESTRREHRHVPSGMVAAR